MKSLPLFKTIIAVGIKGYRALRNVKKGDFFFSVTETKTALAKLDLEQRISFLEETLPFYELNRLADRDTLIGILESSDHRVLKLYSCYTLQLVPHISPPLNFRPFTEPRTVPSTEFAWTPGAEPPPLDQIQKLQATLPTKALHFYVHDYLLPVLEKAIVQPDGYMVMSTTLRATGKKQERSVSGGSGHWVDYGNYHSRSAGLVWEEDGQSETDYEYEVEELQAAKSHRDYRLKALRLSLELRKWYDAAITEENIEQALKTFQKRDAAQFSFQSKQWTKKYLSWR